MSVYHGDTGEMVAGTNDAHSTEKNSGDLGDITGTIYCYHDDTAGVQSAQKECWNNKTIWQAVEGGFPIFIEQETVAGTTPTATSSSHPTSSISPTPKKTETATPTSTITMTNTETNTPSHTASLTPTVSRTSSSSPSETKTTTSSHSRTSTRTGTPSASPTETVTSTRTPSPSATMTKTPHITPSPSATPSNKRKREQMELRVQYPRRSVVMKRRDKKNQEKRT